MHQEDTRKPEMYTPSNRGSQYMRPKLIKLKEEIGKPTGIKSPALLPQ